MSKFCPIYILLGLMTCVNFSCSKDSDASIDMDEELILKKVSYNYTHQPYSKSADFDSEGRISRVYLEDENNIQVIREYLYNEMGLIDSFTHYLNFIYDDNGILIRRGVVNYIEYNYDENLMTAQGYWGDGEAFSFYEVYEFLDNSQTKLISIKRFDSSNNDELIGLTTYQYDVNNPIEITVEMKFHDDSNLDLKFRYSLTYDTNKNPFVKGLSQNAYIAYSTILLEGHIQQYNLVFKADNNLINISEENFISNQTTTISKSYSYNNQGYPLEAEVTTNNIVDRYEIYEYH